jgi:hypothetical protein
MMVVRREKMTNWPDRGGGNTSAFYLRLEAHHVVLHDAFPYSPIVIHDNKMKRREAQTSPLPHCMIDYTTQYRLITRS